MHFNTPPIVTIPEFRMEAILNMLNRLLDIYDKNQKEERPSIVWYLMVLFSEVNQFVEKIELTSKNTAATLTQEFKNKLTQHIYTHHTVKEYAQLLHVTPNHLNKSVKKTLNKTAQSLLNEMLILEAKSLLKHSDLSISEIAEKLCQSTPSNFSRFFKNQTGLTPRAYLLLRLFYGLQVNLLRTELKRKSSAN